METQQKTTKQNLQLIHQLYLVIGAILIASGVASGLFKNGVFHGGLLRYFTYVSNILLVLSFLFLAIFYRNKYRHFVCFSATLAIVVTGLVYNLLLVPINKDPWIFSDYANFIIHFCAMLWAVVNYIVFETKGNLKMTNMLVAMIFPFLYWVVFIVVGYVSSDRWFPYFFMDTQKNNFLVLVLWLLALLFVFGTIGLLTILFDKKQIKNKQ